jgi:uncharacterized membrane protein
MMEWRSHLNPVFCGLLILLATGWILALFARIRKRFPLRQTLLLLAPKLLVLLILLIALFEPVVTRERLSRTQNRLIAVVDVSGSMQTKDGEIETRQQRAENLLSRIKRNVPAGIDVETLSFDTRVHDADDGSPAEPGTDLGACLLDLAGRANPSTCLGVLMLTDGGDEVIENPVIPSVPLLITGIGSGMTECNDLFVENLELPATAEIGTTFEISADLRARDGGDPAFRSQLKSVTALLEQRAGEAWTPVENQTFDLSSAAATARFKLSAKEPGSVRYRIRLAAIDGEVSDLNNWREGTVEVRRKSLRVLFFSRELGMEFKMLRTELGRDQGVSFTGLFRTIGERFTVLGEDPLDGEGLSNGFPGKAEALENFDCLIIGSFPANEWNPAQLSALAAYVENGGSVIFLGGQQSFGAAGYAGTTLEPLFPWTLSARDPNPLAGEFPAVIPPEAVSNPILAGLPERLRGQSAVLESITLHGSLKPSATILLAARVDQSLRPVIVEQSYGKGRVMVVATDTLWKWARKDEVLRDAYGRFWRQAVRQLAGEEDRGRILSVRWNKAFYRPGEEARLELGAVGAENSALQFDASVTGPDGSRVFTVKAIPGLSRAWEAGVLFGERGKYELEIKAMLDNRRVETYHKELFVAPLVPEGARLEVNETLLKNLAARSSGEYWPEKEANALSQKALSNLWKKTTVVEEPIFESGPWIVALLLVFLMAEWLIRRKFNLF